MTSVDASKYPEAWKVQRSTLVVDGLDGAALTENYRLLRQHRDYLDQIITHQFDLSETKEAFEVFLSGRTGKVVVVQDGADGRAEGVA